MVKNKKLSSCYLSVTIKQNILIFSETFKFSNMSPFFVFWLLRFKNNTKILKNVWRYTKNHKNCFFIKFNFLSFKYWKIIVIFICLRNEVWSKFRKKTIQIIVKLVLSFHIKYKLKNLFKKLVEEIAFEKAFKSLFQISFFKVFVRQKLNFENNALNCSWGWLKGQVEFSQSGRNFSSDLVL